MLLRGESASCVRIMSVPATWNWVVEALYNQHCFIRLMLRAPRSLLHRDGAHDYRHWNRNAKVPLRCELYYPRTTTHGNHLCVNIHTNWCLEDITDEVTAEIIRCRSYRLLSALFKAFSVMDGA